MAEDIQDALKDLLGVTIKEILKAKMDFHLRQEKSQIYGSDDYKNGYERSKLPTVIVL